MSKPLHASVPVIARDLSHAETTLDAQIEASATLLASIARERADTGAPFGALQGAMSDAGEAISLALRGRHHLARAHARLLTSAVELELVPETAHGDIVPWCEGAAISTPLHAVA